MILIIKAIITIIMLILLIIQIIFGLKGELDTMLLICLINLLLGCLI